MAHHARCRNCGCFRPPVVDEPDLFAGALPFPTADDPFLAFHRESQRRERKAAKLRRDREVGAERQARRAFTLRCLQPHQGA